MLTYAQVDAPRAILRIACNLHNPVSTLSEGFWARQRACLPCQFGESNAGCVLCETGAGARSPLPII